ncbi:DUF5681 domain-containing protein [Ruegeria sediminis]|uniref:DUF5681 domain-containing protein n=1 Tax=Ruegeria sediminis TaxID=2583820 RepID=UPI001486C2FD|nr:DUF5681 domain-containing protein [Ruegeria sediminis]
MSEDVKDYEVGYGKPPKTSRFQKGQSGNPKGRPKGAKGLNASLKRELESKITVREGNREIRISKAEAMAKRITTGALKGDPKMLMALLKLDAELFNVVESEAEANAGAGLPEPVDFDILRDFFSAPRAGEEDIEDEETDDVGT